MMITAVFVPATYADAAAARRATPVDQHVRAFMRHMDSAFQPVRPLLQLSSRSLIQSIWSVSIVIRAVAFNA